jgi:hypothetical protein
MKKNLFCSELGSPSFQKILRSEDEEDDDDEVAGRVGDWRNMGNIEPTNIFKFKQLEEYMEGSRSRREPRHVGDGDGGECQ